MLSRNYPVWFKRNHLRLSQSQLLANCMLECSKFVIVITFYSLSCLGQKTAMGLFGLRVKLPPVHHTRWKLHTDPKTTLFCKNSSKHIFFQLRDAIKHVMEEAKLQTTPHILTKVIQLYETKNSRHSVMIVGQSGSGKSVTWHALQSAMTYLKKKNVAGYNIVKVSYLINMLNLLLFKLIVNVVSNRMWNISLKMVEATSKIFFDKLFHC